MSKTAASLKSAPKAKEGPPPRKSKKKVFVIVAVLIILIGGYEAKTILMAPHFKAGQKVPLGKILPLDQLTVNLSDGHLVQASISLQLTSVASPSAINSDLPRFDDAAISVLSTQTYQGILPAAARDQIKAQILQDCQKIVGTADGAAQQVSAVYFTSFVVQ